MRVGEYSYLTNQALPRAINPIYHAKPWNFFTHSSPALLYHAVKEHGWSFIPNQTNSASCNLYGPSLTSVGVVLYTTYLTSLHVLSPESRNYQVSQTFKAGALAGAAQALAAAPIDAITTRFEVSEILESKHLSLWRYGYKKLQEIGVYGVFAGSGISLVKESLSFALYFASFELVKGTWYHKFVNYWYRDPDKKGPNRAVFPTFVLFAGGVASLALQIVQYPLGKIQKLHFIRLEAIDVANKAHTPAWQIYLHTYSKTFKQVRRQSVKDAGGSIIRWLYTGFWWSSLVSMPSTSIGLVVFEIMRLRYSSTDDTSPFDENF